jgi:hypothetical protein
MNKILFILFLFYLSLTVIALKGKDIATFFLSHENEESVYQQQDYRAPSSGPVHQFDNYQYSFNNQLNIDSDKDGVIDSLDREPFDSKKY